MLAVASCAVAFAERVFPLATDCLVFAVFVDLFDVADHAPAMQLAYLALPLTLNVS